MAWRRRIDPEFQAIALERLHWIVGRPAPFWIEHWEAIRDFAKREHLTPVPQEHLSGRMVQEVAGSAEAEAASIQWPGSIYGGMKVPHLHYKDRLYLLDRKQWNAFSNQMVAEFRASLKTAGVISFEQLMQVGDAVATLGKAAPAKAS